VIVSIKQNPLCRAVWKGSPKGVMLFGQGSCRSELVLGGVPTMDSRALRLVSKHAASLTTIASELAPAVALGRQGATVAERMPGDYHVNRQDRRPPR